MTHDSPSVLSLTERIRRAFPPHPVPPYPEQLGLDPTGEFDEYASFADTPWPDVPRDNHRWAGYDIPPQSGFPPHLQSYHLPGFLTAALLHEGEVDVIDGLMWRLRDLPPPTRRTGERPGWGGEVCFAHYSKQQAATIAAFLQFVHDHGQVAPYGFVREANDDGTLDRWRAFAG